MIRPLDSGVADRPHRTEPAPEPNLYVARRDSPALVGYLEAPGKPVVHELEVAEAGTPVWVDKLEVDKRAAGRPQLVDRIDNQVLPQPADSPGEPFVVPVVAVAIHCWKPNCYFRF